MKPRPSVLLTNDDSHASPLFQYLIEALRPFVDFTIVVPATQQSWKGKSFSSYTNIHLHQIELFGHSAFTISGTPADCVNIGIYHLLKQRPDFIISGINAGQNSGSSFVLSSGTVGACLEGNVAGIPGIALSQHLEEEAWNYYRAHDTFPEAVLKKVEAQSKGLVQRVLPAFLENPELLSRPVTWNINFPYHPASPCQIKICPLGNERYHSCFIETEKHTFRHRLQEVTLDTNPDCDHAQLYAGQISVSPITVAAPTESNQQLGAIANKILARY